jgi:hypothetical protein
MKVKLYALKLLVLVLPFSPIHGQTNEREVGARVKHVTATTSDGLIFSAWIMRQNIYLGRDMVIYFRVDNRSGKSVYLVRKNTSHTVIEDDAIIFPEPLVLVGTHEEYNYSFTKVASGDSYRGQLKVIKDEYKKAQSWRVNVGFGYVTEIKSLNPRPDQIEDPAPLKSLLNSRLRTLSLSSLNVNVIEN